MAIPDGKPATDFSAMNREWVRAVAAEAAESVGLPEITEADEGKVLTVESGEAAWATAGGVGILVIHTSAIPEDPDANMILDKTWKEIYDAVSAGKPAYIFDIFSEDDNTFAYCSFVTDVSHTGLYTVTDTSSSMYSATEENEYPKTTS